MEFFDYGVDGFAMKVPLPTKDSIVYRFEINTLNLSISHDCDEMLKMRAVIYKEVCRCIYVLTFDSMHADF